jgi:CheY-like chemotaxis protein
MKLLYIEDTPSNVLLVQHVSEVKGYELLLASTGQEGLTRAQEKPDLILIDIRLPDLDGYEVTRRLRALLPETPIVALTAYALEHSRARCLEAGCTDYLAKPYRLVELLAVLNKYDAAQRR